MRVATAVETGAEGVRWDMSLLAPSEEAMRERLDGAVAEADAFVERWPEERIAAIEAPGLAGLLEELGNLKAARKEAENWTMMSIWTDSENPAVLDVQAWVNDRLPRLDDAIRHFELAWLTVSDERAQQLAADDAVSRDRHYLLSLRRFAPFMLSAAEERVLSARDSSAEAAWKSLRDRTLGALVTTFDDGTGGREWPLAELESARRSHEDRDVRRRALQATTELLDPVRPVLAQSYDSLVADRLAVDRLRGHRDPMEPTNLMNEVDGSVVENLLAAAEAHTPLAHRWLRTKARLMGLEQLDSIDFSASALEAPMLPWEDARRMVVEMFAGVSLTIGDEAEKFFTGRRIDAEPRRGKPSAAFCLWPSTRVPGFVFLNWHGRLGDLLTLVHELGHGVHGGLAARAQTDLSFTAGLTISEVPSTFAELLLVEHLLAADDERGRALLTRELDQAVVVGFMAAAFARFEQRAYALRAEGQALTPERLDELASSSAAAVWGDAMTDEHGAGRTFWASLPHFVHERFYTYAYTFAFLLAAGLVARSKEDGFGDRYERFLTAGGSASPDELMAILGVDLHDPNIWNDGFAVLEGWIDRID
jgi:oligoendopeptidase F